MRPNQNTDHAKAFYHFTNKWKIRFDYRKSLHKKISLNALIFDWIKIYFLYKKPWMETKYFKYKYILIEYKYIFSEWQNLYITKIFFFSLNINIYNFLDKKTLNIKTYFYNTSATILYDLYAVIFLNQCLGFARLSQKYRKDILLNHSFN